MQKMRSLFFKLSMVGMIINYSLRQMSQSKSISCSHFLYYIMIDAGTTRNIKTRKVLPKDFCLNNH